MSDENVESPENAEETQKQMDAWRQKIDELRVRGHLLKMELRDQQDDVVGGIESAYEVAKAKFIELKDAGETEAGQLGSAFKSAWQAFKKSYDDATED